MTSAWGSISEEILINICSKLPRFTAREADHDDEYEFGEGVAASRLACRHWAASVPHGVKSLCVRGAFPVGSLSRNLSGLERLTWEKVRNWAPFTAPSVRALVLKFEMPSHLFRHVVESFPGIESLELLRVVSPGCFDLSPLASLTSLRSLVIIGDRNTIAGLESLCNLTSLTLREYKKDILHLPSRLESLGMVDCTLNMMQMQPVARLSLLTALDLSSSRIDCTIIPLTKLSSLTTLDLSSSRSVCDIRPLAELTSLTTLDLSWCSMVQNDIKPLADFTSLKSLTIHWPGRYLYFWGYEEVLCGLTGLESLSIVEFDEDDEVKEYVLASVPFPIVFV